MYFFNFHHHFKDEYGIYNYQIPENTEVDFFSVGIHPAEISDDFEEKFQILKEISKKKNCFAIGECGLDGLISVEDSIQEEIFEKQILWANEIQKPVIIHCVRRFSQLIRFRKMAKVPLIVHGFNKKQNIANELLENDFYLSFGKALISNVSLQTTFKEAPIDRIFLETDNEIFNIEELYLFAADLKKLSVTDLQEQIFQNLETIKNG